MKNWFQMKENSLEIVIGFILHIECNGEKVHPRIFDYTNFSGKENFKEEEEKEQTKQRRKMFVVWQRKQFLATIIRTIQSRLISRNVVNNDAFYQYTHNVYYGCH